MGRRKTKEPASDKIYEELKEQILSFELKPGQLLVDRALTEYFGVSRTPVREALIRLTQEGLVSNEDGRIVVSRLTYKELEEIYVVRESLEGMATRLAASLITEEELNNLRETHTVITNALAARDYSLLFTADCEFHKQIATAGRNQLILDTLSRFNMQIGRIRYLGLMFPNRTEATVPEHAKILEAIETRDFDAAEKSARMHVAAAREAMGQYLQFNADHVLMNLSLAPVLTSKESAK